MSLIQIQERLKQQVRTAALELFGIELDQISSATPPRPELGDLAFPVSFELAKLIKQGTGAKVAPRTIAEQLKARLESTPEVARVEVAGAGYLNVFFERVGLLSNFVRENLAKPSQLDWPKEMNAPPSANLGATSVNLALDLGKQEMMSILGAEKPPEPAAPWPILDRPKKMVEHTSINPNKAAHIGHVRNAVLGDTFVRILQAADERVEIQNYIDNTGVQVADVVVGFMHIEKMNLDDIKALDQSLLLARQLMGANPDARTFDYYCWDLYTRVGLFYRDGKASGDPNPERLKLRTDVLHALEEGNSATAELADYVATRNVECILDTMERLGIRYDLLARESDILHLHFWDRAFALMKKAGVLRLETQGKHAGCWVMPFESHTGTDEHESDKIIVRSNGTVTYTGKDIAYQLWKLGHLGLDFNYTPFRTYPGGHIAWVTTTEPNSETLPEVPRPDFGSGIKVYNVIDSRQSYPQEIVARGVAAVVPDVGADASTHLGYEMVALSPAACAELGIELSEEDRARPYIEMSGRKGLGVKADDLIDRLESDALREVSSRHAELSSEEQTATAHDIAVGALRYFLLKFTRNSVIAFDFKEALSFEGETGPYCQYAAVRANSIFRKLPAEAIADAVELIGTATSESEGRSPVSDILADEAGTEIWSLVMLAERLEEVINLCAASAEPANLAKYTFTLARAFNLFYHRHRIIAEEDATRRAVLIAAANITRRRLTSALETLGIAVPERM